MKSLKYHTKFDIPTKYSHTNFMKIVSFYLFSCPVSDVSYRGKCFKEYGFDGQKAFAFLKSELLKNASSSLKGNYKPCKKEELNDHFQTASTISPPNEYCIFLANEERRVMDSLFKSIRNAFAHGSFNVKSYNGVRIYFLMNYKDYKKAQIVLQESTLLAWIKIVQSGYPYL